MKLRKTLAGILGAVVMLLGVGTFEHVNRDTGVRQNIYAAESTTVEMKTFTTTSGNMNSVVSYTTAKGGGTSDPLASSNQIRLYQGSPGGNIKVSVKDGYILSSVTIGSGMATKISYAIGTGDRTTTTYSIANGGKYTINDINNSSVTIHCMGTNKKSRLYVNYLSATYVSSASTSCEHTNVSNEDKSATCTEDGYHKVICDDCSSIITNETIDALGHDYENNICKRCGDEVVAYTLVEDASTLKVDDQVVIVASGYDVAMSTAQNENNRGQANVTKDEKNKTVVFGDDTQVFTVKAGKSSNSYAFYTGSGYIYAASSSKNYLRTETTLSNNSSWTVSISGGTATVEAQGSNTRNLLQYNNSSKIFAAYSGVQQGISIYKYIKPHTHVYNDVESEGFIATAATCTEPATYYKSCECGIPSDETFVGSSALGHDYHNYVCTRCSELQSGKTYSDSVVSLFNDYYNDGSYTKDTELNLNDEAINELLVFHAQQSTKYRTTVYENGSVTMVSGNDGYTYGNYSQYKDQIGGGVYHTGFKGDWPVEWDSVEDEFVTLYDFKTSTTHNSWTYENGVYTFALKNHDDMKLMARNFVVPMLTCDVNYLTYDRLTVEEVNNTLVMKVYLTKIDEGKVLGSEYLLSTAVITKGVENINYGALITFGVNGNAIHSDGSGLDLEKDMISYSFDNYTLDITVAEKVSKNARDAKGNSCIKMATNSDASEFAFNVSDNVNKVTIYVAGYTSNNATITVNGDEYSITTLSDNGEYTPIVVDTTNSKTVTIKCAAKTGRCMIDSIALN